MKFLFNVLYFFSVFQLFYATRLLLKSPKNMKKVTSAQVKQEIQEKAQIFDQLSLKQYKILKKYCKLKKKSQKERFLKAHSRNLMLMSIIGGVFGGILATRIKNEVDLFFKIRRLEKTLGEKALELDDINKKTQAIKIPFDKQFNQLTGTIKRIEQDVSSRMLMANDAILAAYVLK